jgi:hypothetical protein
MLQFEPHTDLIKRGKVRTPVEFGHKVFLAESAKGLITQYEVLKGNPCDEVHVAPLNLSPDIVDAPASAAGLTGSSFDRQLAMHRRRRCPAAPMLPAAASRRATHAGR